jgi:imidazolonepropionase-like amidohydrolase
MKLEALQPFLAKKAPVVFSAHRADDIMTALRLAEEFDLVPMLTLATEGYLILDKLAAAKVPVIVHPTMQRPSTPETFNGHLGNAALLADRKLPLAICTAFEGYVPKTRVLRYEAAMAAVNGLGFDRALRSITLDAAKIYWASTSNTAVWSPARSPTSCCTTATPSSTAPTSRTPSSAAASSTIAPTTSSCRSIAVPCR